MDKLLDKARPRQTRCSSAMKLGRCSALRNKGMLLPTDRKCSSNPSNQTHLPRSSAASLINRKTRDKDAYRRKMGKLLPYRWTFKTETHLSPPRVCSTFIID